MNREDERKPIVHDPSGRAPLPPRRSEVAAPPEPPVHRDAAVKADAGEPASDVLLGGDAAGFKREWDEIQTGFVDEPQKSVERADGLVARATQTLAEAFTRERERLEEQWRRGTGVSTEDLRLALRRYRSFFDRLLSI